MLGALLVVCLLSALPCLTFRYLPMTDLPQHEAIVSIMRHMHDRAYGFDLYYDWALDRTLYVFPYFLAVGLSYLLPLRWALHVTVFLATVSYPLGVLFTLRALKKPLIFALLALPLLYNRSFFWGFVHFNLGLGLAFLALSQLVGPWSKGKGWGVAGLCVLSAVSHVYGLVFLLTYVLAWLVAGERRTLLSRVLWLLPAMLALGYWAVLAAKAPGYGGIEWSPFHTRLKEFGHSILGGYKDGSENLILVGLAIVVFALARRDVPWTWRRWKRLDVHGRAVYILVVLNLAAYFLLPVSTKAAKLINFRHAIIAAMLLPLTVSNYHHPNGRVLVKLVLAALAVVALANTCWHFWLFNREAREFDAIVAVLPRRPHLTQVTEDAEGAIMRSYPYANFGGYGQAERGGTYTWSFPTVFWNIPVKGRMGSGLPDTRRDIEPVSAQFAQDRLGHTYDCFLVRLSGGQTDAVTIQGEHEIAAAIGPWKVNCEIRAVVP